MKYVIIGNSAAGIGAVEGIRQIDKQGEIVIISNEPHHTYSRPLISYLLLGKTTEEKMRYRGDSFYKDNGVKLIHANVTGIDPAGKKVVMGNKHETYDKLLVGAGSSAFIPEFEGLDTVKDKFSFMSLDDAKQLDKALGTGGKKVLIIGAGLIGLKCAEGIAKRISSIAIIDLAPRILSSILDDDGAKIIQNHIENTVAKSGKGIIFKLGQSVKKFEGNKAHLDNGDIINFDILVLAVGVRPNTSLLKDIANIDRGIIVDNKSQTSAQDIYSAGDCTQTNDASSGQSKIMALLPNAYMQGECAGINMAGGEKTLDNLIPMNAIGFFGLHMVTAGNYNGDQFVINNGDNCKKLFYSDNKLNGFIIIGNVEKAGIYTSLIREKTPLNTIDFALVCEKPGLMAFTKEIREEKLGSAA